MSTGNAETNYKFEGEFESITVRLTLRVLTAVLTTLCRLGSFRQELD